jgi:hypothetical protein
MATVRELGSLPICGAENRLAGMLTDRDIVVRCIGEGGDPATPAPATWPTASPSPSAPTTPLKRRCA